MADIINNPPIQSLRLQTLNDADRPEIRECPCAGLAPCPVGCG